MDCFSQQERGERRGERTSHLIRAAGAGPDQREMCAIYLVVISATELATLELEMLTSLAIRLGSSYLLS